MQTFSDDLTRLVLKGKITPEEAYIKAIDKEDIRVTMQNAGVPMDFLTDAARQDQAGRLDQARNTLESLRGRTQASPDDIGALNDLAWLLSTSPFDEIRNGKEAVRLAERARDITRGQEPAVLDTLGAAYAEVGRFNRAIDCAKKAVELATARNDVSSVGALHMRIREYSQNRPYRDT
jgi:tetratricopeptide (TPR) repeat protein